MHFDDPAFLFEFLPAFCAAYFTVAVVEGLHPRLAGIGPRMRVAVLLAGSAWLIATSALGWLLLGSAFLTVVLATIGERTRSTNEILSRTVLALAMTATIAVFAIARGLVSGRAFEFAGVAVLTLHQLAFIIDVHAGRATTAHPAVAWLYLIEFPLLPAGPIVRFQDIARRWSKLSDAIGLGAFTYGMRRLITGLVKVIGIASTLAVPVDAIYGLPPSQLTTDVAWFAAVCFSLQLYYQFSGYADIAIGLGRMIGFRYPENFHRPYVADSVREFWRRWQVTSITWLRDYFAFPMAGRDRPTFQLFPSIITGFSLLGLWYGGGWTVVIWAAYSSAFLAIEAVGFGTRLSFWPAPLRHLYVLAVVIIGWAMLRADSIIAAGRMLQALAGVRGLQHVTVGAYLTTPVLIALVVALVGAGPLIPWLSRWRVSVDAVTASIVMMITSTSLLVWRAVSPAFRTSSSSRPNPLKKPPSS